MMIDFLIDAAETILEVVVEVLKIKRKKRKDLNKENENGESNGNDTEYTGNEQG